MRLQRVGGGLVALGAVAVAVELRDDLNLAGGRLVVCIDHFLESTYTQHAGVGFLEIKNQHLAACVAERVDHRLAGQFAALEIVGAHMALDCGVFRRAFGIHGKHRDSRLVGCLHRRSHGESVAWHEHNGSDILGDEIVDLVGLLFHVHIRINHLHGVPVLFRLGLDVIADNLEEGIGQCQRRVCDHAFVFGWLAFAAAKPGCEADCRDESQEFFHDYFLNTVWSRSPPLMM